MIKEIYLDNGATTKPCKESVDSIIEMISRKYGNPSSLHDKGFEAEQEVEKARQIIAKEIRAKQEEIYFTSGGTESNNIAILGTAEAMYKRGKKIVTTSIEHSSVYNSVQELKKQGYEIICLKPDEFGKVTESQISNAIDENTILVSIMMVNNEVGSILPVDKLKMIIKEKKSPALLHVDAVQAFGKMSINVEKLKVDLMSISGHKVHGPKGVGALYKRKGIRIVPRTYGGEQQQKIRPGTEPVPLIAGFGAAVEQFKIKEQFEKIKNLNDYCRSELMKIENIILNSPEDASPYIINFSTNMIKSETMLHYLSSKGIYVSSGSACAKGQKSRVLSEMGLSQRRIDTAIRVSFSKYNTKDDVNELISQIKTGIDNLAHI